MKISFQKWLSSYFSWDESDVVTLIKNPLTIEFLITWSIYETKCFKGFCNENEIKKFTKLILTMENFVVENINSEVTYFYTRYQDNILKSKLMHEKVSSHFDGILSKPLNDLSIDDKIFLIGMVVYRYRNNIFHGNKKATTWLNYSDQIRKCTDVMRYFINVSEYKKTS